METAAELPRSGLRTERTPRQVRCLARTLPHLAADLACRPLALRALLRRVPRCVLDRSQDLARVLDQPGPRAIAAVGFLVQPGHEFLRQPDEYRLAGFRPLFALSSFHLISPSNEALADRYQTAILQRVCGSG